LMGPWNPWLHEARIGKTIWDLTKAVAEYDKLPDAKLGVAFDVAAALTGGGVLPEVTYRAAVDAFGVHGAAELYYLVGGFRHVKWI